MAKCTTAIDANGNYGSTGSSGSTTPVFTIALNPDGTKVKDTRK